MRDTVRAISSNRSIIPIELTREGKDRLKLSFRYNAYVKDEVKASCSGAKWNPKGKYWSVEDTPRTHFTFDILENNDNIKRYDIDLNSVKYDIDYDMLFDHQKILVNHVLTRRRVFWMVEMGLGKTLAAIKAMEYVKKTQPLQGPSADSNKFWVVCPKNVSRAWQREIVKWKSTVRPRIVSVDSLKKAMDNADLCPYFVVFDESSKIKTPTSKRSKYAMALSAQMETVWGHDSYVICMTGTPSPKDHRDIYWQAEVARPGYLREKNYFTFQKRIGIIEKEDGPYGSFSQFKTFKDGTCAVCGVKKSEHDDANCYYTPKVICKACDRLHTATFDCGLFSPSEEEKDEIDTLAKRMQGLTISLKKESCLDLPEKLYTEVYCKPSQEMLQAAELVQAQQTTVISMLSKLRQFSDGFLYEEEVNEDDKIVKVYKGLAENPKVEILNSILAELDDAEESRVIIYAGFKASIDIIVDNCVKQGWNVIAVDGRGWRHKRAEACHMEATDEYFCNAPKNLKIAFVAHPGSAGLGLNLQVVRKVIYYSNDFNAESRLQSEDRAHRSGMRAEGVEIIDLICLGTDKLVRDNLMQKRDAQNLTMRQVASYNLESSDG